MKMWFRRIFLGALSLGILFSSVSASAELWTNITATTAGQPATIRLTGGTSEESITLQITRPDKTEIKIPLELSPQGITHTELSGIHLQQTGLYQVTIFRGSFDQPLQKVFSVLPGTASPFQSSITTITPSVVADGQTNADVIIKLRDAYGNPVTRTRVRVFSSRNEDSIRQQDFTDAKGELRAKISAENPGVSIISALAGEVLLYEKPQLVFHLPEESIGRGSDGFGKYLQASLFDENSASATEYFTLEGLNAEQTLHQDLTLKVSAKDSAGNIDPNFRGTIRFTATDDKAELPADYTFTAADQGVHTFYLAISFGSLGEHTLSIHDLDDFRIAGQLSVNVLDRNGQQNSAENPSVTIDVPTDGATFNAPRVTISGGTQNCETVRIEDGPTILTDSLPVDGFGKYNYQTPTLADGYHEFTAFCREAVSNKVGITIDRTPPSVMSVEINPQNPLLPGQEYELNVGSGEDLSGAQCVVNNEVLKLSEIDTRNFRGNFIAPQAIGSYPMECTIFDLLGNQLSEPNAGVLEIRTPDPSLSLTVDPNPPFEIDQPFNVQVFANVDLSTVECQIDDKKFSLEAVDLKNFQGPGQTPSEAGNYTLQCTGYDADGNPITSSMEINVTEKIPQESIAPTAVTNLSAQCGEDKITLFWSPATDDVQVSQYQVNFGKCGEPLTQINTTPDDRTQWYVDELIPFEKYCFTVQAVDEQNNFGPVGETVEGIPSCAQPSATKPPKSGGSGMIALLVALCIGGGALLVLRGRRTV